MSVIPPAGACGDRPDDDDPRDDEPGTAHRPRGARRGGVRTLAGTLATYSALAFCAVLAMVATAAPPSAAAYGGAFAAVVVVGPTVVVWLSQSGSGRWSAAVAGGIATAAVLGLYLVIAGIVVVLGNAAAVLLPLVAAAVAVWLWMRRDELPGRIRSGADRAGTRARNWLLRERAAGAAPVDRTPPGDPPASPVPPVPGALAAVFSDTDSVSTGALCRAWHDSYWLLSDSPPGPARNDLVAIRSLLLDELERRDPGGFRRWLDSAPRAGSDPRPHLGRRAAPRSRSDEQA